MTAPVSAVAQMHERWRPMRGIIRSNTSRTRALFSVEDLDDAGH